MSVSIDQDLKDVLLKIDQRFDRFETKLDNLQKDVNDIKVELASSKAELSGKIEALDEKFTGQIKTLDEKLTGQIKTLDEKLTGQIKTLDEKTNGISKRLDTQEFINRSVVVGFVLAVLAGLFKLFFPNFNLPNQ